ncbi:hypothetical protein SAMN05421770_10142 [Granulicella rosea]|uniref:Uncharacterized protein n=1 Tax=Granulicella rosea TaxID=474952 RepID=A0A239CRR1_9BACT|nr:hypothetical protein [Granulicella rosea]SNS22073.1 hypothetical protein SAMN05421770_10142 [Granulicella rosea]
MNPRLTRIFLPIVLFALSPLYSPAVAAAAVNRPAVRPLSQPDGAQPTFADWRSTAVQHAYGLPDTKPNAKGTLLIDHDGVVFTAKASSSAIPRGSIVAVSAGNQRVELWGTKGRVLRMLIPDGGGIAAAGFMHHRQDMLTVEFTDSRGGYHGAVFLLPANEAEQALKSFAGMPPVHRETAPAACLAGSVRPKSVLVAAPVWEEAEVPAAYRALVYERLVDRLRKEDAAGHIYRDGESMGKDGEGNVSCPQYVVHLSIAGFKPGSQVKRAVLGPVGMFVGTTQISFDARMTDATGRLDEREQIKSTVRGEGESTKVADGVAKNIAKHFLKTQKSFEAASAHPASVR